MSFLPFPGVVIRRTHGAVDVAVADEARQFPAARVPIRGNGHQSRRRTEG